MSKPNTETQSIAHIETARLDATHKPRPLGGSFNLTEAGLTEAGLDEPS